MAEFWFDVWVTADHRDKKAQLLVKVTDEGIILDLVVDGEVIGTFGATAQELADDFIH